MSSVTSRAQPSDVLKQTIRTGSVLAFRQVADDRLAVRVLFINLTIGTAEIPEIVQDQIHIDIKAGNN
jgi:hypothetical protein